MKRIITFLLTLVLTCCLFACDSCSNSALNRKNPTLIDTSSVFASIQETIDGKAYTYNVTRGELYLGLKKEYGYASLTNLVDQYLLASYYQAVTEDEIKEKINIDVYGKDNIDENGNVTLTDDKKAEAEKDFLETMCVSYGCNETSIYGASIAKKYRLSLAQSAYARVKLDEEVEETNKKYQEYLDMTEEEKAEADKEDLVTAPYFADSKYANLYNKEHVKVYTAIIVPFTTAKSATDALTQIGVQVVNGKWTAGGVELTTDQVIAKYIELYTLVYGYKYSETLTKESDAFQLEVSDINSNVASRLKDMENNQYYATPYLTASGSLYFYVLKLAENEVVEFEDLDDAAKDAAKAEYEEELREAAVTSTYITKKLAELRKEKNFAIYDDVLEAAYVSGISSTAVEYKETTDELANVVARVDGKDFTCEELFATMCEAGESAVVIDLLVAKRLLNNPKLNTYYQDGNWTNNDKKKEIEELLDQEKKNFKDGTYTEYGYDPNAISWISFIESSYGVSSDEELMMILLAQEVTKDFTNNINVIEKHEVTKDENSKKVYNFDLTIEEANATKLWQDIQAVMQKTVDEYFSVKGIHILVSAYETVEDYQAGSSLLDPTADDTLWTAAQKEKALELCEKIAEFIKDEKGTYQEKLEKIVSAYKQAPVGEGSTSPLATITSNGVSPVTINLSKYKAYGLTLKWESLGSFTNGSMVESFNDAVKAIWDKDMADEKTNRVTVSDTIETKYGYHVYVNLASNSLSYIDKNETGEGENKVVTYRYLPTIEEIRKEITDEKLTSSVTNAISKYYEPIKKELSGTYFVSVLQYNALTDLLATYNTSGNASSEDVAKFLELYVDYVFESNLKSVTKDFISK